MPDLSITFHEDTDDDTVTRVLDALTGFAVDLDHVNDGYPHDVVVILRVDRDEIVPTMTICEMVDGRIADEATWDVPLDGLRGITIL